MKRLHLTVFYIFIYSVAWSHKMQDALSSQLISAEWTGSSESTPSISIAEGNNYPKMSLSLRNLTHQELEVELDEGFFLKPTDPQYQRMLLVQKIKIKLKPDQRYSQPIYAFCTQASNSGPSSKQKYALDKRAEGALLDLANIIADKKYFNSAAQDAVWSFTDGSSILNISSTNTQIENELQSFVARRKKVNLEELKRQPKQDTWVSNLYLGKKIDRNIPFSIDSSAVVSVGYYESDGQEVRNLIHQIVFQPGSHSFRYDPFPLSLRGKRYMVKMFKNGLLNREYYFSQI